MKYTIELDELQVGFLQGLFIKINEIDDKEQIKLIQSLIDQVDKHFISINNQNQNTN